MINLRKLLRRFHRDRPININALLLDDEIKHHLDSFIEYHLSKADSLMLVWHESESEEIFCDYCGFTMIEALGTIETAKQLILNEEQTNE